MPKPRRSKRRDDPGVAEVRKIREQIWKEAGGTPEGLIKLLNERHPMTKTATPRRSRKKRTA